MSRLFLLSLLLLSCQAKEPPEPVGSVYYESWVFVGKDQRQDPLVVYVSNRKSQDHKKKVNLEVKAMMSKEQETRLIHQQKKTTSGVLSKTPLLGPLLLVEEQCEGGGCLSASFAGGFVLEMKSELLPALTPHDWHKSRVGDAITRATLTLDQTTATGCLFVERAFAPYGPPSPFYGNFDWFALLDEAGDCWLLTDGTRVGSFALSSTGATGNTVRREVRERFTDAKSGQEVASAWSLLAPAFALKATLAATSGHRSVGATLSPTKKAFYGHGSVEGAITVAGQSREVIGWVQHVTDE
jgi:hypothetical protein